MPRRTERDLSIICGLPLMHTFEVIITAESFNEVAYGQAGVRSVAFQPAQEAFSIDYKGSRIFSVFRCRVTVLHGEVGVRGLFRRVRDWSSYRRGIRYLVILARFRSASLS